MRYREPGGGWAVVGVALLLLIGNIAGVATAAGETGLSVSPRTETVNAGQTVTLDVVLENADGGVGAAELRVAVDDPAVASIRDVSVRHDPMSTKVDLADDGSWADIAYIGADTNDSGSVRMLEITVEGATAGSTEISILPRGDNDDVVISDEEGTGYDITDIDAAALTVESSGDGGSNGAVSGSGAEESDGTDSGAGESDSDPTVQDSTDTGTDIDGSTTTEEGSGESGKEEVTSRATTSPGEASGAEEPMKEGSASDREASDGESIISEPATNGVGPLSVVALVGGVVLIGALVLLRNKR